MPSIAQEAQGEQDVQGFVRLLDEVVEGGEGLLEVAGGAGDVVGVQGGIRGVRAVRVVVELFGVELLLKWLLDLWLLFVEVVLDWGVFSHLVAVEKARLSFDILAYKSVAHYFEWKGSPEEVELFGRSFGVDEVIIDPSIVLDGRDEAI